MLERLWGKKKVKKDEPLATVQVVPDNTETTESGHKHDENCKCDHAEMPVSEVVQASSTPVTAEVVNAPGDGWKEVPTKKEEVKDEIPSITFKELRALKKAKYDKIYNKFKTAYLLKNTKTGQIVEIRAASSFHACNIIGWKKNHVKVISTKEVTEEAKPVELTSDVVTGEIVATKEETKDAGQPT